SLSLSFIKKKTPLIIFAPFPFVFFSKTIYSVLCPIDLRLESLQGILGITIQSPFPRISDDEKAFRGAFPANAPRTTTLQIGFLEKFGAIAPGLFGFLDFNNCFPNCCFYSQSQGVEQSVARNSGLKLPKRWNPQPPLAG
ncbi:MAG: hypothetical protein Q8P67_15920, partial [archaeon]|nr:hypothetical protein [archaeon]